MNTDAPAEVLRTSIGEFPLAEYRLGIGGREWRVLHTRAVLGQADEAEVVGGVGVGLPYGVALWPAAIALAHEAAAHADELAGASVLELGAGTGLPGIVAAALGARVVQTDRHPVAMAVARRNAERNAVASIEHRLADWTEWDDAHRYDVILGADVLYGTSLHPHLRRIFDGNLAPGGRILLSDPFRGASIRLLEEMEADGWAVSFDTWRVGVDEEPRPVGVFALRPPSQTDIRDPYDRN